MKISSLIAPSFWNTFNSKKPRQIDKGGRGSTKTSKNSLKVNLHCPLVYMLKRNGDIIRRIGIIIA